MRQVPRIKIVNVSAFFACYKDRIGEYSESTLSMTLPLVIYTLYMIDTIVSTKIVTEAIIP
jgi:hypothetical protein